MGLVEETNAIHQLIHRTQKERKKNECLAVMILVRSLVFFLFFGFVSFVSTQRIVDNEEDITMTLWSFFFFLFSSFFFFEQQEQGKHQTRQWFNRQHKNMDGNMYMYFIAFLLELHQQQR
jgi:hypothetical protein